MKYDITFITKADNSANQSVQAELEKLEAKIISKSILGQKPLAFPIKKETAGFFQTLIFDIDPEKLIDLNKKLALDEEVLRFLITSYKEAPQAEPKEKTPKMPDVMPKAEKIEKPKELKPEEKVEAQESKEEKKEKPEIKKEAKKPKAKKPAKTETPAKEKSDALEEAERLEALDKKLDELLKE